MKKWDRGKAKWTLPAHTQIYKTVCLTASKALYTNKKMKQIESKLSTQALREQSSHSKKPGYSQENLERREKPLRGFIPKGTQAYFQENGI